MVSIILPIYAIDEEVRAQAAECIARIHLYAGAPYELIVVENGSHYFEDFVAGGKYFHTNEPLGFAKALNIGLAHAKGDYLCLISADTWPTEGWLAQFVQDCDERRGGPVCASDGRIGPLLYSRVGWGACWIIGRDVFARVGYHSEEFNQRFSDQDFWIRCHQAGHPPAQSGRVKVEDQSPGIGSTVRKMPEQRFWRIEEDGMMKKWGAPTYAEWLKKQ